MSFYACPYTILSQDNGELKALNDELFKERERLSGQVEGLTEELEAMHKAWLERDARQRAQVWIQALNREGRAVSIDLDATFFGGGVVIT